MQNSAFDASRHDPAIEGSTCGAAVNLPPLAECLPLRFSRLLFVFITVALLVLPLMFGAVHPRVWWSELALIFGLTLALAAAGRPLLRRILLGAEFDSRYYLSGVIVTLLCGFLLYCLVRTVMPAFRPHPYVLEGLSGAIPDLRAATIFFLQVLGFMCSFLLVRCWCGLLGEGRRRQREWEQSGGCPPELLLQAERSRAPGNPAPERPSTDHDATPQPRCSSRYCPPTVNGVSSG